MGFVRCSIYRAAGRTQTGSRHRFRRERRRTGHARQRRRAPPAQLIDERTTMYNATEQFAELNKANVAKRPSSPRSSIENAEKLVTLNINAAKARARARRRRRASRRVGQGRAGTDGAARQVAEVGRAEPRPATRAALYELVVGSASAILGARRGSVGARTRRASRRGSRRRASRRRPARMPPSTRSSRRSPLRPPRSTSSRRRRSRS